MQKGSRPVSLWAAVIAAAALLGASPAVADGVGPRLGLTGDPDQVHLGMHLPTLRLAPHLGFMASFEAGLGDNTTLFSANMDFKYVFPTRAGNWHPYAGAGPALHLLDRDGVDDDMEVGMDTPLISSGIVDSFSMVSLKVFLEKKYGISLPDSEATPEAFDTVNSICELVKKHLG